MNASDNWGEVKHQCALNKECASLRPNLNMCNSCEFDTKTFPTNTIACPVSKEPSQWPDNFTTPKFLWSFFQQYCKGQPWLFAVNLCILKRGGGLRRVLIRPGQTRNIFQKSATFSTSIGYFKNHIRSNDNIVNVQRDVLVFHQIISYSIIVNTWYILQCCLIFTWYEKHHALRLFMPKNTPNREFSYVYYMVKSLENGIPGKGTKPEVNPAGDSWLSRPGVRWTKCTVQVFPPYLRLAGFLLG